MKRMTFDEARYYRGIVPFECKKCGNDMGFRPTYLHSWHSNRDINPLVDEWLEWACVYCGYKVESECKDAQNNKREIT